MFLKCHSIAGDIMDFAEEVRRLRDSRGWSQKELADKAGVSRSVIAKVETGKADASAMEALNLVNIARAFGLDPLYFLFSSGLVREEETTQLEIGRFVRMPENFAREDREFIKAVADLLGEFIEKYKKPKNEETWSEDNDKEAS